MKLVAISDTHLQADLRELLEKYADPEAVFIHAGDALNSGSLADWNHFAQDLKEIKSFFKRLIYVPGNHDKIVESMPALIKQECKALNIDLLIDEVLEIDGVRFFGSPFTPDFGNWSFMYPRGTDRWNRIPDDVDVVITHGPPYKILDGVPYYQRVEHVGCWDLARAIQRVKPKVALFGHIHEGFGHQKLDDTDFYNVSICNDSYSPLNPVTVIEFDNDKNEVVI